MLCIIILPAPSGGQVGSDAHSQEQTRQASAMGFQIERQGDVTIVVVCDATLDWRNGGHFMKRLAPVLASTEETVFDLTELKWLDSSGFSLLLYCQSKMHDKGGEMNLCCASDQVMGLFRVLRLHRVFDIFATRSEAVQALQPGQTAADRCGT